MSHIPAAAMPHAKAHEEPAEESGVADTASRVAAAAKAVPLPWAAVALGGVLALGGVVGAALLLGRGSAKPARKPAKGKQAKGSAKSRKPKAAADAG